MLKFLNFILLYAVLCTRNTKHAWTNLNLEYNTKAFINRLSICAQHPYWWDVSLAFKVQICSIMFCIVCMQSCNMRNMQYVFSNKLFIHYFWTIWFIIYFDIELWNVRKKLKAESIIFSQINNLRGPINSNHIFQHRL